MGYIGRGPVKSGAFRIIDDISSSFNGSTTGFTVQHNSSNITPGTEQNLLIAVDGVMQEPVDAFTISGSTITFTSAPASGASFWGVELGDVGGVASTVANGTVGTTGLADDAVDGTKIADNAINSEHYTDASIDTAHIGNLQITNALMADDAVGIAELSATGTASSSTFLRGDNVWAAAGGGAVSAVANGSDNRIATFSSTTALNGESALTFNGTTLTIGSDYDVSDANGLYKRTNGTLQLNSNSSMAFNIDSDSNQSGRSFWFYNNSVSQSGTQIAELDETGVLTLFHGGGAALNLKNRVASNPTGTAFIRFQGSSGTQHGYIGYGSSTGIYYIAQDANYEMRFYTNGVQRLTIAANGTLSGSSTNDISDERLKENIVASDIGLAEILQLRPVKFNFKAGKGWGEPGQQFYGLIAQEAEVVIPESVTTGGEAQPDDQHPDADELDYLKSLSMSQITTALIKAVQELNAKVDAL